MTAYATETAQSDERNVLMIPSAVSEGEQSGVPARLGSWELPHEAQAAGMARRITRRELERCAVAPDTVDHALLVVSELVTNAVQHALPPVGLVLSLTGGTGAVHIAVADGGASAVKGAWSASCTQDEGGRGRSVVAVLTRDRGTYRAADRVTHWAELPLAG